MIDAFAQIRWKWPNPVLSPNHTKDAERRPKYEIAPQSVGDPEINWPWSTHLVIFGDIVASSAIHVPDLHEESSNESFTNIGVQDLLILETD